MLEYQDWTNWGQKTHIKVGDIVSFAGIRD